MLHDVADALAFLGEAIRDVSRVGAVCASSDALARAVTQPLAGRPSSPVRVLEVGAGTGAITAHVVRALGPMDRLDVCEPVARFADVLHRRFDAVPGGPHVVVHQCPASQVHGPGPWDFVLSSIPVMNMQPEDAIRTLDGLLTWTRPGGAFAFWHYSWWRAWSFFSLDKEERARRSAVAAAVRGFLASQCVSSTFVPLNLPPAVVHLIRR